jgi:cell division protein FtsW
MGTGPDEMDTPTQGSDRILLVSVIILMIFGTLAVYSSIAYFAESNQTTAGSLVFGHIIKLGIAFLAMLFISKINYHAIAKFSRLAVITSWILLIIVAISGNEVFGAKRYLDIGGFSFQPSSFATVALLIHLAVLIENKQDYIKDFKRSFLPLMIWVTITCGLIGIEDFSSAAILLGISMLVMFVGRVSVLQLGTLVIIGLLGSSLLIWQSPERQSRIDQYVEQIVEINSEEFNVGSGYQAQQAHMAIA